MALSGWAIDNSEHCHFWLWSRIWKRSDSYPDHHLRDQSWTNSKLCWTSAFPASLEITMSQVWLESRNKCQQKNTLSQTRLFPPPPCLAMVLPHRSGVRPHMVTFPSGTLRTFLGPFTQQKQCRSSKDLEGDPPTACWFSCLCFHHTDIPKSGWAPQAELAHVYSGLCLSLETSGHIKHCLQRQFTAEAPQKKGKRFWRSNGFPCYKLNWSSETSVVFSFK